MARQPAHRRTNQIPLLDLLIPIWQRWRLLLSVLACSVLLVLLMLPFMTPRYASDLVLILDRSSNDIATFDTPLTGFVLDSEAIASEIEIIYSRALAAEIIESLSLMQTREFNPALGADDAGGNSLASRLREAKAMLFSNADSQADSEMDTQRPLQRAIDQFLNQLSIQRKGISKAIVIEFESVDAARAAAVVNAIASRYVEQQLELKSAQGIDATRHLQDEIETLRSRLSDFEVRIAEYRLLIGQGEDDEQSRNQQNIASLNAERVIAQADHSAAVAVFEQAQSLAGNAAAFASLPSNDISPALPNLRQSELELQTRIDQLSLTYGDRHPLVLQANTQLQRNRQNARSEIDKSLKVLEGKIRITRARAIALQEEIDQLQQGEASTWSLRASLLALERERAFDVDRLEFFSMRLRQVSQAMSVDNLVPFARVISPGQVSESAVFPAGRHVLVLLPLFVTLLFVGGLVLSRLLKRATLDEVPQLPFAASWISCLPHVSRVHRLPFLKHRSLIRSPAYAVAMNDTGTNVDTALQDSAQRVVLVCALERGDGATSFCVELARQNLRKGGRTALIDLNFRHPGVRTRLQVGEVASVDKLLSGKLNLGDICLSMNDGKLLVLCADKLDHDPQQLLSGRQLAHLINVLSKACDLVIIDSPPILDFPDSGLLSRLSELTLLLVSPRSLATGSERLDRAIDRLGMITRSRIGVLFNKLDVPSPDARNLTYLGSDRHFSSITNIFQHERGLQIDAEEQLAANSEPDTAQLDSQDAVMVQKPRPTRIRGESWLLQQSANSYSISMLTVARRPDRHRHYPSPFLNNELACFRRLTDSGENRYVLLLGIFCSREEAEQMVDELRKAALPTVIKILKLGSIQREILAQQVARALNQTSPSSDVA